MKEDDAGGGSGGGQNESKKSLKRKSEELIVVGHGKKSKKNWTRKYNQKKKKFPKKPRSLDGDQESANKLKGQRRKRRRTRSFNAPFNSTQFLMNDHVSEAVRHLDSVLNDDQAPKESDDDGPLGLYLQRGRGSSFSIDTDDDYYYSSPEDEEEFMSKEFIKDYDNVRNDRLIDMSKAELINEYLQMEQKIEALEKRLKSGSSGSATPNNAAATASTSKDMESTIRQFQKEIQRLESENDQLKQNKSCTSSCSSSSCSSSESEDSSSDSSSDEAEEELRNEAINPENNEMKTFKKKKLNDDDIQDDTGYESGQSNKKLHSMKSQENENTTGIEPNEEKEVAVAADATSKDEEEHEDEECCPDLISVNCISSTSP